jgi:hypothetical protein
MINDPSPGPQIGFFLMPVLLHPVENRLDDGSVRVRLTTESEEIEDVLYQAIVAPGSRNLFVYLFRLAVNRECEMIAGVDSRCENSPHGFPGECYPVRCHMGRTSPCLKVRYHVDKMGMEQRFTVQEQPHSLHSGIRSVIDNPAKKIHVHSSTRSGASGDGAGGAPRVAVVCRLELETGRNTSDMINGSHQPWKQVEHFFPEYSDIASRAEELQFLDPEPNKRVP